MNSVSSEDFVKDANALFADIPIPPMNQSASGTFARVIDIPPILMCESNTVFFYEEYILVPSSNLECCMEAKQLIVLWITESPIF